MDTDQQAATGYKGSGITIGAEYMLETSAGGDTHLYRYAGSGADWAWTEIPVNGQSTHPDVAINLVTFDRVGLAGASSMSYQIQTLDASYNLLYSSYPVPFSLDNTSFVFDIGNHP
jgi:hypothetical protein